jgi:hypothetical protein
MPPLLSYIEVTVTHSPLAFIYNLFTPTIQIDDVKQRKPWGVHSYQLPPGDYEVSVSYPWLFSAECGKSTVRVHLEIGQTRKVTYYAGFIRYVPGKMSVS